MRVLTLADHREMQALRQGGGDILERMHGDIRAVVQQAGFEFLDEQALAADGGKAAVENAIALGGHRNEFDLEAGVVAFQCIAHVVCLP